MKLSKHLLVLIFSFLAQLTFTQVSNIPLRLEKTDFSDVQSMDVSSVVLLCTAHRDRKTPFQVVFTKLGESYTFNAVANDMLGSDVRAAYPEMMTFDLYDLSNKLRGAMTSSSHGLYGMVFMDGKYEAFNPDPKDKSKIVFDNNVDSTPDQMPVCQNHPSHERSLFMPKTVSGSRTNDFENGQTFRRYRLAVVCTGEFYAANGNNDSQVMAAITNSVNNINVMFKTDMALQMDVTTARIKLYNDPVTDPFTPDDLPNALGRTDQASQVVNSNFASSTYDIGHVFHKHSSGDNWSTGGVAYLESVCDNGSFGVVPILKGGGWSGSFSNNNINWYQLAAHEFGHQFGATHTFNGTGQSCTDAISEISAVEIGSGTTIMSYSGICDAAQNIPTVADLDSYFHSYSIQQMSAYIQTIATCGALSTPNNAIPVVEANPCGSTLEIPRGTAFYLKGSATDANASDVLTYTWEQMDEDGAGTPTQGLIGTSASGLNNTPLFRSLVPSTSSERYFPSFTNPDPIFEVLPNVARNIKLALTVRDNSTVSPAVAVDQITLKVSGSGPFVITKPNGSETFTAGMTENITWNTNGSAGLCSNVRIKLSLDNGVTYPITVAENVPYASGSYMYNIPSNMFRTTSARLLIECMDKDCVKFYDLSNSTFRINSTCDVQTSVVCPTAQLVADQGAAALNITMDKFTGNSVVGLSKTVSTADPQGHIAIAGVDNVGCERVSFFRYDRATVYVTETGSYTFSVSPISPDDGFLSIHRASFDPSTASSICNSFIASTAVSSGTGGYFPRSTMTAQLTACTEYVIGFYTFALPLGITITNVTGPGLVIEKSTPLTTYTHAYMIVNEDDNSIAYIGQSTDMRTLGGGNYRIYSIMVQNTTEMELQTFVNGPLTALTSTKCISLSSNSRPVKINSSCNILSITAGAQGACEPSTNLHTQDIIVTFNQPPTTGKLRVNGQEFDITTSPQTVKLIGLDSDGATKSITAEFTAEPSCKRTANNLFTSPPNCCPAVANLGTDKSACAGTTIELDAGGTGQTYRWFKDGVEIMGQTGSKLSVVSPGEYEVESKHSSGCTVKDKVVVAFNALPTVSLLPTISVCEGSNLTIQGTVNGGTSYQWLRGNTVLTGETTPGLNVSTAGSYTLIVTNAAGCTAQATTIVAQVPKPTVELGPNIQKCQSESVILDAGTNGTKYQWFRDGNIITGATMQTYAPTQSGIYRVVIESAANCSADDQVNVMFFASPSISMLQDTFKPCSGVNFSLMTTVAGQTSITWLYNNAPIANSNVQTLPVTNSGTYVIEAVNNIGCKTTDKTYVQFIARPNVNLGADVSACIGTNIELNAGQDGTSYVWKQNGTTLSNTTPKLIVTQSGNYSVTVTNSNGCSTTGQRMVTFIPGPSLDLGGDKAVCQGQSITIDAVTNATNPSIKWIFNGQILPGQTGLSISAMDAGTYEVILVGGTPACEVTKSINLVVNPIPGINLGQDRTLCEGETLPVLDAGANHTSIQWTLNGSQVATTRTLTADKSGTYKALVSNSFNCINEDEVKVTINPLPTLTVDPSYNLCSGQNLTITAQSNGTSFVWKKGTTVITGQTTKALNVTTEGTYTVTATTAANCMKESTFTVVSRPTPVVELGINDTICPGETKTINAGMHTSYVWSDNASSTGTVVIPAGNPATTSVKFYAVTVTNQFGCTNKDSITITSNAVVNANIVADNPGVCNGEPVVLTASGGNAYAWSGPAGTLSATNTVSTTASPTVTSKYFVDVSDTECPDNRSRDSIEIKVFEPINLSAGRDTSVIKGRTIKLNATGGVSYQWDNTDLIVGASNISRPEVMPTEETIFTVTITDKNGCEFVDDVVIRVIDDPLSLFKPVTLITPNGDGANDFLFFQGLEAYPENTLRVYNRWGNLVYSKDRYLEDEQRFDGTKNRERLPADTYYYILTFEGRTVKSALTIIWD